MRKVAQILRQKCRNNGNTLCQKNVLCQQKSLLFLQPYNFTVHVIYLGNFTQKKRIEMEFRLINVFFGFQYNFEHL